MASSKFTDPSYLRTQQYRTASNLDARIQLHRRFSTNPRGWFSWLYDRLNLPEDASILEIGTGPGDLWVENSPRIPIAWQITLTDISAGMARQGRENLRAAARPVRFAVADAQDLPFSPGSFHAVIANHMLYHVPDLPRGLAEIARLLRPGGILYAATNGEDHMRGLFDLVNGFLPGLKYGERELSFRLENGAACLAPYFSYCDLHRYENSLAVTEVDPLLAYVLSMDDIYGTALAGRIPELYDYLQTELAHRQGVIHIGKEVGLFIARK